MEEIFVKVVELLGYPSVSMLCEWKRMYPEMLTPTKRKKPRKWAQASFDLIKRLRQSRSSMPLQASGS